MDMRKLLRYLRDLNARLVRRSKHDIWELPNGQRVTVARTPSDHRAIMNTYHDIKRAAALPPGSKRPMR